MEYRHPGTLLNNCGFDLWQKRYVNRNLHGDATNPWQGQKLLSTPLSTCEENRERHVSRWCVQFTLASRQGLLFGCTEDIRYQAAPGTHVADYEQPPFCRKLRSKCEMPVCSDCWRRLALHDAGSSYNDGGTIPMSISNDHYYGHISRYIVENDVTWLECAACCTVWSTMLVYYLEAPYGHLIDVPHGKPEARTQVKGNLFSFSMPWEDIEKCCRDAGREVFRLHDDRLRLL